MNSQEIVAQTYKTARKNISAILFSILFAMLYKSYILIKAFEIYEDTSNHSKPEPNLLKDTALLILEQTVYYTFIIMTTLKTIKHQFSGANESIKLWEHIKIYISFIWHYPHKITQIYLLRLISEYTLKIIALEKIEKIQQKITSISVESNSFEQQLKDFQENFNSQLYLMNAVLIIFALQILLMTFDWVSIDQPQVGFFKALHLSVTTMFKDGAMSTFLMICVRFWWIFLFLGFFDFYVYIGMTYFYYQYCDNKERQPNSSQGAKQNMEDNVSQTQNQNNSEGVQQDQNQQQQRSEPINQNEGQNININDDQSSEQSEENRTSRVSSSQSSKSIEPKLYIPNQIKKPIKQLISCNQFLQEVFQDNSKQYKRFRMKFYPDNIVQFQAIRF